MSWIFLWRKPWFILGIIRDQFDDELIEEERNEDDEDVDVVDNDGLHEDRFLVVDVFEDDAYELIEVAHWRRVGLELMVLPGRANLFAQGIAAVVVTVLDDGDEGLFQGVGVEMQIDVAIFFELFHETDEAIFEFGKGGFFIKRFN